MSLAEELIEYLGRTEGPSEPEQGPSSDATGDPSTPRKGGTADPTNQNPSAFQGLTPTDTAHPIPGLTKENLIKFLTVVVNIAPEIDVGLKGIDLSWAVLEAVPGFLRTLWGNWLPAGL